MGVFQIGWSLLGKTDFDWHNFVDNQFWVNFRDMRVNFYFHGSWRVSHLGGKRFQLDLSGEKQEKWKRTQNGVPTRKP